MGPSKNKNWVFVCMLMQRYLIIFLFSGNEKYNGPALSNVHDLFTEVETIWTKIFLMRQNKTKNRWP